MNIKLKSIAFTVIWVGFSTTLTFAKPDFTHFDDKIRHAIEDRNVFLFSYYLKNRVHGKFTPTSYAELLRHTTRPQLPQCFTNAILKSLASDFPNLRLEEYLNSTSGTVRPKGMKAILDSYLTEFSTAGLDYEIVSTFAQLETVLGKLKTKTGRTGIFYFHGEEVSESEH